MRDLAEGKKPDAELLRTYDLRKTDLNAFLKARADEIAEIGAAITKDVGTETAGMWISRRRHRLAELQDDVEDINYSLDYWRDDEGHLIPQFVGTRAHQNLLRSKMNLLKLAAEEIDGPRHNQADDVDPAKNVVHYVIEADDYQGDLH